MPIVERIIIGLLGFAFIAGAAGVINNANRMRRGIEPERITLI